MGKPHEQPYQDDLAYIHDAGYGGHARAAAAWLLETFRAGGLTSGLVVDLGCGSGIWAEALSRAGYDVLGYDLSAAMIAIARRRVPTGRFVAQSFLSADFPPCIAVTAMGEIFNYLFDRRNSSRELGKLFGRVYKALEPGGLFVFDGAEPGRAGKTGETRVFSEGQDWAVAAVAREDRARKLLTRRITSFRRLGKLYRRNHEVHVLRLFDRRQVLAQLRSCGLRAGTLRGYGQTRFPQGYVAFAARKPR
jgi:SAM-dependent methyltransferase